MVGKPRDIQESEDIKLVYVLDTSGGECEDSPSQLKKCNVKRNVNLEFLSMYNSLANKLRGILE
jgi:hypothetical protein